MLRAELGPRSPSSQSRSSEMRLARRPGAPRERSQAPSATTASSTGDEDRLLRSGGKSYPDLVRARTSAVEAAPDAVCCRRAPQQVARVLEAVRSRERRGRPVRRRHQRRRRRRCRARGPHRAVISLDLSRMMRLRGRPHFADRTPGPRPSRPRRPKPRSPRTELTLGPLPAVVRVRHDRRLRRDPFGRTGLGGVWPLRRAGERNRDGRAPPGRSGPSRRRTPPQGPPCARSSWAPRGRSA